MQSYSSKYFLLLLIFAILVLLISIVGVSFAYSFYDANNSKYFSVKSGFVTLNSENNGNIIVDSTDNIDDSIGITDVKYQKKIQVVANVNSVYDIGIKTDNQFANYIKVAILDENRNVVLGKTDNFGNLQSGVSIESLKNKRGDNNLITEYSLISDKISASKGKMEYSLIIYYFNPGERTSFKDFSNAENINCKLNIIASQK